MCLYKYIYNIRFWCSVMVLEISPNGLKDRVNQIMHLNASQPVEPPAGVEVRAVSRLVSYTTYIEECEICHFVSLCCCQTLFLPTEIQPTSCVLLRWHYDLYWYQGVIISKRLCPRPYALRSNAGVHWIKLKGDFWTVMMKCTEDV